jgi:intein/homing endonuclease
MNNLTPEFSEILGLLCAEGHHSVTFSSYWGKDRGRKRFYKNQKSDHIEFFNKDVKLLTHFQKLLNKEFNYYPSITKHGKINICIRDIIRSIINYTELGHLKWRVPENILNSDNSIKIAFLRGYFDGDGTVSNRIRFFSTNIDGLRQVSKMLNDLDLKHTLPKPILKEGRKPLYYIQISEKERERFLKIIKPISKRPGIMRG